MKDPIKTFIAEGTISAPTKRARSADIHAAYVRWATKRKLAVIESLTTFGRQFKAESPYPSRMVHGSRVYLGIGLKHG